MGISTRDVIPLSTACANLSELAEEVNNGAAKIITRNGERYIARIDASRLDYYDPLECERIHRLLIDDVATGKVKDARSAIAARKRRSA